MRGKILKLISEHPDIDTRVIIDAFSIALDVPKRKICGYLSSMVQNEEIEITIIRENELSTAKIITNKMK